MQRLPKVDIVICGLGWAGSVMLAELADTGLDIVGLERGGRTTPAPGLELGGLEQDDLQSNRGPLMQNLAKDTLTFRHRMDQQARPIRQSGAFLTGETLGGAGVTWNGIMTRYLPHDFHLKSFLADDKRLKDVTEGMQLADFGVSYDELEADYDWFEAITGTSGIGGNINGKFVEGGNPFEGFRSNDYVNPPLPDSHAGKLFRKGASKLGYHPYTLPATNMSREYTNAYGLKMNACAFCGYCDRFRCPVDAKGSPHNTLIPFAERHPNVQVRTNSRVLDVELSADGKRATGVRYVNEQGEICLQPADVVVLSGYAFSNTHWMLLSGIGKPYDPETDQGTVGRGYAYHVRGGANVFFDESVEMNSFMGSGGLGTTMDDFNAESFDSLAHGFVGGAMIGAEASGARPIRQLAGPIGTPRWGLEWKQAVTRYYNHIARLNVCGASMAYRQNNLSLDPNYKDPWGRPLLRLTFDFTENEIKLSRFMTERSVEIGKEMGGVIVDPKHSKVPYDNSTYQGSHNTGGAIMGTDPATSAVNTYLQSWDVQNVFVVGGSAFPQLPGKNPTATIGALARRSARAIREIYLKTEDKLAS